MYNRRPDWRKVLDSTGWNLGIAATAILLTVFGFMILALIIMAVKSILGIPL